MKWKNYTSLLILILAGCKNIADQQEQKQEIDLVEESVYVISCTEVDSILSNELTGYVLFDVRKKEDYEKGHLPGAHQVWRNDFNETKDSLGSFIGSRQKIEAILSGAGVKQGDTLILYDDRGGVNAARFWFVLSEYGWDRIKIMNGGIVNWKKYQLSLSFENTMVDSANFSFQNSSYQSLNIEIEEVNRLRNRVSILDSRTEEEYTGTVTKKGAAKGGRIPNSIRFDWSEVVKVSNDEDHTLRKSEVVLNKLKNINMSPDDSVIVYCQSAARSSLLAFYFTKILRFKWVRNYDGSWIEWSHHEELPFETGVKSVSRNEGEFQGA